MEKKQLDFDRPLLSVRRNSMMIPASQPQIDEKSEALLPKIPPLPVYKSELKSGPVRNPGTVPFSWEQSPGRPKDEAGSQSRNLKQNSIAPRLPPGWIRDAQQKASIKHLETTQMDYQSISTKGVLTCTTRNVKSENVEDCNPGEEDDDTYADAVDTFSRSESFFLNCSISGVGEFDDPNFEPSGAAMDPQARDFMMGRFLPAAKAMASGTPPYAPRKQQSMAQEKPMAFKKVLVRNKVALNHQNNPIVDPISYHKSYESSEESEEHDETDDYQSTPKVACGLLSQLCFKNSLRLLNPVPGMKTPTRKAASVRRIRSRYPLAETFSEHGIQHHKVAPEARKDKYEHLALTVISKPAIGPDEKNRHLDPGVGSTDSSKNFGKLLGSEDNASAFGSGSPIVEKTVYVDTVCEVKYSDANRGSTDRKVDDNQGCGRSTKLESNLPSISSGLEVKPPNNAEKEIIGKSDRNGGFTDCSIWSQSPNEGSFAKSSSRMKNESNAMPLYSEAFIGLSGLGCSEMGCFGRPVAPPLPKAPKDSWLKRAMLTKKATSRSLVDNIKCGVLKFPPNGQKWETIVKTSNTHHERLRFSAEKLDAIPEA